MPTELIVLNVLLAVAVIAGIVGLLARSIATQPRKHFAEPTWPSRTSHKHDPLVAPLRHAAGSFDSSGGTGTRGDVARAFPRVNS
jgi:hypothetical protein